MYAFMKIRIENWNGCPSYTRQCFFLFLEPCFVNPCQNGGKCKWNKGKKKEVCKCTDGFSGAKCEIEGMHVYTV